MAMEMKPSVSSTEQHYSEEKGVCARRNGLYIYISGAAESSISSISLILYFNQMRLFP